MATELMHVVFQNSQRFSVETGTICTNYSGLSILSIILIFWNLAEIMFSKFPFYLYQRKRKMNVTFAREFFTFRNSSWALFLERSYFTADNQSACCYSWFQKQHPLWRVGRGVFRTQSSTYDGAFLQK